jgi:exodeoxyribonuclease VII large subunit
MPVTTTAEAPLPVRRVSQMVTQWIDRLGAIWVEGQVTQVTRRPGQATVFLVLRDTVADMSLTVMCNRMLLDAIPGGLGQGAHIVVHAKPRFFATRGTFSLSADEIRPVGVGELLARLEQLRSVLAAEGLFAADRKRTPPFLPTVVGLICGRSSAAEKDVVENARRRWPAVRFRIEEVAVQGPTAVTDVGEALQRLEADPEVDVIVITRGGGSIEDLLPFSNEALVRAVSAARTPIVSAIGHEQDTPLLDLVADVRASTPTDAAKCVVPDVREEVERVTNARRRLRNSIVSRLDREVAIVLSLRSRPCLAEPQTMVDGRALEVLALRDRARRTLSGALDRADDNLAHTRARVTALSPQATLERGYAVLQREDGSVVRRAMDTTVGELLRGRVAQGELTVEVRATAAPAIAAG